MTAEKEEDDPEAQPTLTPQDRVLSRLVSECHDLIEPEPKRKPLAASWYWCVISKSRIPWRSLSLYRPLSHPLTLARYLSWAVPGLGMFSEAYILFAIGNIEPLLSIIYPACWGDTTPSDCNQDVVSNVSTIEICGIVAGMLIISFFADWMGRKKGSRVCTTIMSVGAILLTSADGSASTYLTLLCIGLAIFGFGVGGEYPLAASSAAERAEGSPENRKKRGQTIALTFTQQGWGNWANTLVILILLACVGATGRNPTSWESLMILHVQFAVGLAIILALLVYRFTKLEESRVWEAERHGVDKELEDEGELGKKSRLYTVILSRNWSRLFETCFAWFLNDFVFYGNKLFQSRFIGIISGPDAPLFTTIAWTLLNSSVALCGYFASAFLIDKRWYGRFWIQVNGFLMLGVIFLVCAIWYEWLITNQLGFFQFLYFFSSFWGQFGPNATTYVVPGEVFPTDVRAFFHGALLTDPSFPLEPATCAQSHDRSIAQSCNRSIVQSPGVSAAVGKLGAIAASQVFAKASVTTIFYVSAGCGFFGCFFTWMFLPDTTGLDLGELDRYNRYLLAGLASEYHGEACNPLYLSVYERLRGYGKQYDPVADEIHKRQQHDCTMAKSMSARAAMDTGKK